MNRSFFIILVVVGLCAFDARGQVTPEVSVLSGYTIPNSAEYGYIADVPVGVDVAAMWRQEWVWQEGLYTHLLRRPFDVGLRCNFTYFPNDIAGHRIGVAGMLSEPVAYFGNNVLNLEYNLGLAWYTNPYRRTPNPRNVFIGSYTNCFINVGPTLRHSFRDGSALVLGAKLVHSSNGYLKKPNKGLNYLQAEVGWLLANPNARVYQRTYRCDTSLFRGGNMLMSASAGYVQPRFSHADRDYYFASTVRLGWLYDFNPARSVGFDVDLTYNFSFEELNARYGEHYPPFYVALAGIYETNWHRLTLHTALAFYLLRSEHGTTPIYERVGLFYNIGNPNNAVRQFVGVSLKSHYAHIDFIELHYGVKIRSSYLR